MNDLIKDDGKRALGLYSPEQGLKTIVLAEAAEQHWARAKDSGKLFDAIAEKLTSQAEYVIWRDINIARVRETGGPGRGKRAAEQRFVLPEADPGQDTIDRWRKRLCRKDETGRTVLDSQKFSSVLVDVQRRCARVCEQENANTIRGTEGTGEFERYTPEAYVAAARAVLGEIDLDPASCREAQTVVRARAFFTAESDGLKRDWPGRVFLNPPYHRELAPLFIDKLLAELASGRTTAAVLLTNNSTDTAWFQKAARASAALCFPAGRINFWTPGGGAAVLPTQGQAFTYFGLEADRFVEVFDPVGFVVAAMPP